MSLTKVPRVVLGVYPTPIYELTNFSRVLGGPRIFIKREDMTGLAFGGNKTRQVERLLAYARDTGADTVITTASSQSNYCLQFAAGARRLGMSVGLVQFSGRHPEMQGNRLLQELIGSRVKIIEGDIMSPSFLDHCDEEMEKMAEEFRTEGRKPCVIQAFKPTRFHYLNAAGWVDGAEEIYNQLKEQGVKAQSLVLAASSGCTSSGLMLGFRLLRSPVRVISIAVSRPLEIAREKILHTINETAVLIEAGLGFKAEDIELHNYLGEAYGIVSPECREAIQLLSRTEGIFLDPVYSGKGMAGLIGLVRQGYFTKKDTVLFLHTGGTPALFAYNKELGG